MQESIENINFNLLPKDIKLEVAHFLASIQKKKKKKKAKTLSEREFGFAKGKISFSDDFNDPIPGLIN